MADGGTLRAAWAGMQGWYDRLVVWGNRQPWLNMRRILWLIGGGLWLFV